MEVSKDRKRVYNISEGKYNKGDFMKKKLSLLMALVLSLGVFTACGSNENASEEKADSKVEESADQAKDDKKEEGKEEDKAEGQTEIVFCQRS